MPRKRLSATAIVSDPLADRRARERPHGLTYAKRLGEALGIRLRLQRGGLRRGLTLAEPPRRPRGSVNSSFEVDIDRIEIRNKSSSQPREAVARLVAAAHEATGLPINRGTVVVHADINSVSRRSDPWPPATREARVKRVIARANALPRPPIVTVTVKAGDTHGSSTPATSSA